MWYRAALARELRRPGANTLTAQDDCLQRDLYKNIGTVLTQQGHSTAAIEAFERGSPAAAHAQGLLSGSDQQRDQADDARLLREAQTQAALFADLWRARSVVCDWELYERKKSQLRALVDSVELHAALATPPSLLPFDALLVDFDAAFQRRVAQQYAHAFSSAVGSGARNAKQVGVASGDQGGAGASWAQRQQTLRHHRHQPQRQRLHHHGDRRPQPPALRVAYVSHDFNDHPTAHLMEGLFVHHNASAVAVSVFSYGKDDGSRYRRAIAALASRRHSGFADLSAADHATALEALRGGRFDVCFDAQVHTMGARPALLAARPCSVVVNYLVFPGTSGAAWHDFVIADAAVLPPDHASASAFTEKVALLPLTYQANYYPPSALALLVEAARERTATALLPQWPTSPRTPVSIPTTPGRAAAIAAQAAAAAVPGVVGIKVEPMVFCNFQKVDRLEPKSFALWVRILARVPGSYLHMLRPSTPAAFAAVRRNLAREAAAQGVAARRVLWVDRKTKAAHIARHYACDLFLDGVVYGAHSTAADALFAGLPVLALRGRNFVGRVAASLVEAAGVGTLVVHTIKEFENIAVRLAVHLNRPLHAEAGAGVGVSGSSDRRDGSPVSTVGSRRLVDIWRSRLLACTGASTVHLVGCVPNSISHAGTGARGDSSVLDTGTAAVHQCEPARSSLFDAQLHARDLQQVSLSMWTAAATSAAPMHVVAGQLWNRGRSVAPACGPVMSSRIQSNEVWSLDGDGAEPPLTDSRSDVSAFPSLCAREIRSASASQARGGGGNESGPANGAGPSSHRTPSCGEADKKAVARRAEGQNSGFHSRSSLHHVLCAGQQVVPACVVRDAMLVAQELARGCGA
jgi:hypothetical protein